MTVLPWWRLHPSVMVLIHSWLLGGGALVPVLDLPIMAGIWSVSLQGWCSALSQLSSGVSGWFNRGRNISPVLINHQKDLHSQMRELDFSKSKIKNMVWKKTKLYFVFIPWPLWDLEVKGRMPWSPFGTGNSSRLQYHKTIKWRVDIAYVTRTLFILLIIWICSVWL